MFRFAEPIYLNILWVLPFLIALFIWQKRKTAKLILGQFDTQLLPKLTSSLSKKKRRFKLIFQLLALTFFILSLARPQLGQGETKVRNEGIELMLAVDVSNSMLAEDVKPNRLEQAKRELTALVDSLSGDKVGVIAFAGSAILLSPLTSDRPALKMFIEGLSTDSIQNQGTRFDLVLQEAMEAFERGGADPEADSRVRVTKAVILVSDGEDFSEASEKTAEKIKEKGIRIFSLAFGTEQGDKIPVRDDFGNIQGYLRDSKGKDVITKVSGDSLKKMAQIGNGSFYHVGYSGAEITALKNDLAKLQKTEFDSMTATNYDEQFQIFLAIGLFLAFLDLLLGTRRKGNRLWKGRFNVSSFVVLFGFGFSQLLVLQNASALDDSAATKPPNITAIFENNSGVQAFEKEKFKVSYDYFLKGLIDNPTGDILNFNLAATLEALKQEPKALKQYDIALNQAQSAELQFRVLYNKARLLAENPESRPLALDTYRQALKINPLSKEVKTNIELLFKQEKGGGGKGDGKDKSQKPQPDKDGKGDPKQEPDKGDKGEQKPEPPKDQEDGKGKAEKPKEMSEETISKILDELKRQEQAVRAKELGKGQKESSDGKNW